MKPIPWSLIRAPLISLASAAMLLAAKPGFALTFGDLNHKFKVGNRNHFVAGPFEDEVFQDGSGYIVEATVLKPNPDRLEVNYRVVRDTWNQGGESEFQARRIAFTLGPGEPLRIVGTSFLSVSPLDYNNGGSARWILVDPILNQGTLLHNSPNGSDSFDLSFAIEPGDWELIYDGRAAPGTVGANPTGQPPAVISADFVVFTPEPESALLVGFGLVLLAARPGSDG